MDHHFDTPAPVDLAVDNAAGEVVVATGDSTTTQVEVVALSADAVEVAEGTRVTHREAGGRHVVAVDVPRRRGRGLFGRHDVRVTVHLPHDGTIDVKTASADVTLAGRFGVTKVRTQSGEIRADAAVGPFAASTASGDVTVREVAGDASVDTASGDMRVQQVSGRLEARTASGDVTVGHAGREVSAQTASGDVRVDRADDGCSVRTASGQVRVGCVRSGRVLIRTVSGDVVVAVARGSAVVVDAQTMSGVLESEIPLTGERDGAGVGAADAAAVDLRAQTVSGDIRLVRAEAAPQLGAVAG